MNIIQRIQAPTPKFFRVLRTIGLALAAAGGAILAAPITLPASIITVAGYIAVAGAVASAVSQTAVETKDEDSKHADP
jgi:hypothetical protein